LTSGQLPVGLTLSSSGVISGTPTTYGTSTFSVTASDAASASVSASFTLSIGYLVGDVFPFTGDSAGSFGDGLLNTLDLTTILRGVTNIGTVPAACSDRFDAMDAYPADTATVRGGDGIINTLDLIVVLRRVVNIDTSRPGRLSRNACSSAAKPANVRRNKPASGTLELLPAAPGSGGSQRSAIYLSATADLDLAGLSLSITSASNSALRFIAADQAPSITDNGVAGSLGVAWLNGWSARAGQRILLGYVEARSGSSLAIHGVSANTTGGGEEVILEFTSSRRPPR
jgi:hypothetical protein